ncbi:hypothetical protein CMK11_12660 [Candidatus Poribacteria bacterium]|nr:hypothetical protein [Candidatus Poribacteria bacterium]
MAHLRKIVAVILGAVVGSACLLMAGAIHNAIDPTPPELMDPATPEAVAQRVAHTTTMTWLVVIAGLALGAFLGGVVGAEVAGERTTRVTGSIGMLLSSWAVYTFWVVFPEVLWAPAGMLVAALVCSHLGGMALARGRR